MRWEGDGGDDKFWSLTICTAQQNFFFIKTRRMRWAGHVDPIGESRGL